MLHAEMAFAGGKGLGEVFGDERGGETRPRQEMASQDGAEESRR